MGCCPPQIRNPRRGRHSLSLRTHKITERLQHTKITSSPFRTSMALEKSKVSSLIRGTTEITLDLWLNKSPIGISIKSSLEPKALETTIASRWESGSTYTLPNGKLPSWNGSEGKYRGVSGVSTSGGSTEKMSSWTLPKMAFLASLFLRTVSERHFHVISYPKWRNPSNPPTPLPNSGQVSWFVRGAYLCVTLALNCTKVGFPERVRFEFLVQQVDRSDGSFFGS